jgi:hypothetical protein
LASSNERLMTEQSVEADFGFLKFVYFDTSSCVCVC